MDYQYKIYPLHGLVYVKDILISMKNFRLYVAMVLLQIAYAVAVILVKIAFAKGLNQFVFVAYRNIIAMIILCPVAYIWERQQRPSLTYSVFGKIFVLSSLGTTIYFNVFYLGLAYTSPTVASALNNVIPSLTFVMAVLVRLEKVKITSASGQAKVVGTIICIGGSLVLTFWKGGYQLKGFVEGPLINIYSSHSEGCVGELRHVKENWLKGSCLILISTIAWSGWLVLQGMVSKVYPAQLSLNAWISFIASLQSSLLALFFARNPLCWRLEWNVQLFTIIFCGVVATALANYIQIWCISHKGPVFSSTFAPLGAVTVAIFSAIVFAERLHLSSLIGACLIIVGLYIVLWGKRTDNFVIGNAKDMNDGRMLEIPENTCPTTGRKSIASEMKC